MKPWMKYLSIALVILLVAGLAYGYERFAPLVMAGTGLVAHQICNCLHVSNRELQVCLDDRWPDTMSISAEPITVNGLPGVQSKGLIESRIALYEPGFGCTLQD